MEDYQFSIERILFGEAPIAFTIEVFFRTLIIYVILLIIVNWLGKRMSGQLSITEMAVMLTLGAIVAPAMQIPERGIFFTVLVLLIILLLQRTLNFWSFKNPKVEAKTQGEVSLLVEDGIMDLEVLKKSRLTHQQLYTVIRAAGIKQLGEVEAVYLEACGLFSIFKREEPKPGLSVLPPADQDILAAQQQMPGQVCSNCGTPQANQESKCLNCYSENWVTPVKT